MICRQSACLVGALLATFVVLTACDDISPSPVILACQRLGRALYDRTAESADLTERCGCLDRTARAQLDPENYELLSKLARETVRYDFLRQRVKGGADDLTAFASRQGPGGSAVAALDFTLLAHKAIGRCANGQ